MSEKPLLTEEDIKAYLVPITIHKPDAWTQQHLATIPWGRYLNGHPRHLINPDFVCNHRRIHRSDEPMPLYNAGALTWFLVEHKEAECEEDPEGAVHFTCVSGSIKLWILTNGAHPCGSDEDDFVFEERDISYLFNPQINEYTLEELRNNAHGHMHSVDLEAGQYIRIPRGVWCHAALFGDDDTAPAQYSVIFIEPKFTSDEDRGPCSIYTRLPLVKAEDRIESYLAGHYRIPSATHFAADALMNDYQRVCVERMNK